MSLFFLPSLSTFLCVLEEGTQRWIFSLLFGPHFFHSLLSVNIPAVLNNVPRIPKVDTLVYYNKSNGFLRFPFVYWCSVWYTTWYFWFWVTHCASRIMGFRTMPKSRIEKVKYCTINVSVYFKKDEPSD